MSPISFGSLWEDPKLQMQAKMLSVSGADADRQSQKQEAHCPLFRAVVIIMHGSFRCKVGLC